MNNLKFAMAAVAAVGFAALAGAETFSLDGSGTPAAKEAAASDAVKVRGKGMGADRAAALKDALRDAVERAVGQFVDADRLVKNDRLIKDQVLTFSNAYVQKYDVVSESSGDGNGIVTIVILAQVEKGQLKRKLTELMPSLTVPVGVGAAHAEVVTKVKSDKDAVKLLENALEDVNPLRQLLRVSLVGDVEPVKKDAGESLSLAYLFRLEIDRERYLNKFLPKLQQVLGQVSKTEVKTVKLAYAGTIGDGVNSGRSDFDVESYRQRNNVEYKLGGDAHEGGAVFVKQRDYEVRLYDAQRKITVAGFSSKECTYVGVDNSVDFRRSFVREDDESEIKTVPVLIVDKLNGKDGNSGSASLYEVSYPVAKVIFDWMKKVGKSDVAFDITFKDGAGEDVCSQTFRPYKDELISFGRVTIHGRGGFDGAAQEMFYITPFVNCDCAAKFQWIRFNIPMEDAANVKSLTVEVAD